MFLWKPKNVPGLTVAAAAVFALAACAPEDGIDYSDIERGKQLYADSCSICHGENGSGAGAASLGLGAPPPSLRILSRNAGGVFPRDYVLSTIDGLERHDNPTAAMPEFGTEDMGPLIMTEEDGLATPIPADMLALANYLESIQD